MYVPGIDADDITLNQSANPPANNRQWAFCRPVPIVPYMLELRAGEERFLLTAGLWQETHVKKVFPGTNNMNLISKRVMVYEALAFLSIISFIWIDEIFDMPHLLFGAESTPINWRESLFESTTITMLGAAILYFTYKLFQRITFLEGIVPICSYCKKIRDEQGSWQQMEAFISDRSEAGFSHSICLNVPRGVPSLRVAESVPAAKIRHPRRIEPEFRRFGKQHRIDNDTILNCADGKQAVSTPSDLTLSIFSDRLLLFGVCPDSVTGKYAFIPTAIVGKNQRNFIFVPDLRHHRLF
jgi:hypothetical protein